MSDKKMSGYIRPDKIFEALQYFRKKKHPSYNFYASKDEYIARCLAEDRRTHNILTGQDDIDDIEDSEVGVAIPVEVCDEISGHEEKNNNNTDIEPKKKIDVHDENEIYDLEDELEKEKVDIQNDPVRRQHFDYENNSVIVNRYPEVYSDAYGEQIPDVNFAPGEGKIPVSFLDQKDWDINSWPSLHPDGQFGMDHKRKVKLSRQKYFQQRILNKDKRFAKDIGYVLGAMSWVEADRLRRNANLSGYQGKKVKHEDGQISYSLKDPFSVLAGIPGTPKYWQKVRRDMIAKLENLGPFHWFFTLSCGDLR